LLVGQDWVSPLDFWRLPPGQIWWIIDAKMPPEKAASADTTARLKKLLADSRARDQT